MDDDVMHFYSSGIEQGRLDHPEFQLELARTLDLLTRLIPPPPVRVIDVGGGPGRYAAWLAERGYEVTLVDPVALHVEQAAELSACGAAAFSAVEADARRLPFDDGTADVVLLMGPLYHLIDRSDRLLALREAARVLTPGGIVIATVISRFAPLLDGADAGALADADYLEAMSRTLATGEHRNPERAANRFTTAYFHRADELVTEFAEAGLEHLQTFGVEGPAWMLQHRWDVPGDRAAILEVARRTETEPTLLGMSSHLMGVARRP